jgi:hypothetical protein
VHQEVYVIGLAVELDQLGLEVCADGAYDLFAARKDLVGEWPAPVCGREDQVRMKGVGNRSSPADSGYWGLTPSVVT